jgi:hypothetical protein
LDSPIIRGPFSAAPCQTLVSRFATFSSPYVAVSPHAVNVPNASSPAASTAPTSAVHSPIASGARPACSSAACSVVVSPHAVNVPNSSSPAASTAPTSAVHSPIASGARPACASPACSVTATASPHPLPAAPSAAGCASGGGGGSDAVNQSLPPKLTAFVPTEPSERKQY